MEKTGYVATRVHSISDLEVRPNPKTDDPASSHVVVCMHGLDMDVFVGTEKECNDFVSSEQEESLRAQEKPESKTDRSPTYAGAVFQDRPISRFGCL